MKTNTLLQKTTSSWNTIRDAYDDTVLVLGVFGEIVLVCLHMLTLLIWFVILLPFLFIIAMFGVAILQAVLA